MLTLELTAIGNSVGLAVPADMDYRMHAEEVKQTGFRLDVYNFPQLSRAEIQTVLHLPETDIKKTRFYQEVFHEGKDIGEKLGGRQGRLALLMRQLGRQLSDLTARQRGQIEELSPDNLDALGEALLDFTVAEDLDDWLQGRRGDRTV
jgi:hypothetical protein